MCADRKRRRISWANSSESWTSLVSGDTPAFNEMPTHFKIDTRGSDELFQKMGWTIKNSVPGFLRQEARLTAVELARRTQPFGGGATPQRVGQAATTADIYRVYATPGKAYDDIQSNAKSGFWRAVKTSAWDRATTILNRSGNALKGVAILPFDDGAAHRQLRNNQGRIPKSQKPTMIVKNPSALKSYVDAEVKKVGEGKGGWATCAKVLGGTRGIPGWVSRQNSPAQVVESYKAELSSVTMTNQVPYASEILSEDEKQNAIEIAKDRLGKSVKRAFQEITHRG